MWPYKNIDFGIDLGTSKYSVYVRGEGTVVTDSAYIAFKGDTLHASKIIEIGEPAKQLLGRCPTGIQVMSPMKDGVIIDTVAASLLLNEVIKRAKLGRWLRKRQILVGTLFGASDTERRAFIDVAKSVGASTIQGIAEPLAAAAGCGLAIHEPKAQMIVDIGSGATEIVVVSLGDIIAGQSLRIGGDAIDEALERYILRKYKLRVGRQLAKLTKERMALIGDDMSGIDISGIDTKTGLPSSRCISLEGIREACAAPIETIVSLVKSTLETLPPETSADIIENGIFLSGGGALLPDIGQKISAITNLGVSVTDSPSEAVVRGCAQLLMSQRSVS